MKIDIIAIASSYPFIQKESIPQAKNKLQKRGYSINLLFNFDSKINYESTSIKERVQELNSALISNSKIIMTLAGGYQVNEIINNVDFNLIKKSNKIICGYSDITYFINAMGLVNFKSQKGILKHENTGKEQVL